MRFPWPEAVAIEAPNSAALAGLRPRYIEGPPPTVEWHEAGHVRLRELAQVLVDQPDRFVCETTDGERWTFRELTLERYRERVRDKTVGRPDFESAEDMLEAMRREW